MTGVLDDSEAARTGEPADADAVLEPDDAPPRAPRSRFVAAYLTELLALIPVLAMFGAVLGAPKTQLPDYWIIAPETFNGDGSLAVSTLFSYYNGHILAVPKVLFWLNYELNSGLNTTLGIWVVLMGVGQVLIMRALLPRDPRLDRWAASLLVVGIAVLVFAPQGTHNYVMGMSGASWVLANLFTVAALWTAVKVKFWWAPLAAVPFAAAATVTYGTGVMAWPALLVAAFLRERWGRVHALLIALSVLAVGSYAWFYERPTAHGETGPDIIDMVRRTAQVLGSAVAPDADTAAVVGVVAVVLAGFFVWRAVQIEPGQMAPWIAVTVHGFMGAALIGVGRGGHDSTIGAEGRYAPVSVIFLCGLLVLAVWLWPKDVRVSLAAAVAVGLVFVGGRAEVDHVEDRGHRLDEVAIAARLGTVHSYPPAPLYAPNAYEEASDYLRGFGHYPFSEAFDADCGMLGESLDMATVRAAGEHLGTVGGLHRFLQPYNRDSVRIEGWVHSDEGVHCVLVVEEDRVVGAGAYGSSIPHMARQRGFGTDDIGFTAVAPTGGESYRAVAVVGSSRELVLLTGALQGTDAPVHPASQPVDDMTGTDETDEEVPRGSEELPTD